MVVTVNNSTSNNNPVPHRRSFPTMMRTIRQLLLFVVVVTTVFCCIPATASSSGGSATGRTAAATAAAVTTASVAAAAPGGSGGAVGVAKPLSSGPSSSSTRTATNINNISPGKSYTTATTPTTIATTATTTATTTAIQPATTTTTTITNIQPVEYFQTDSIEKFANDITTVLTKLRSSHYDPTVDQAFHATKRPTFAVTWTHDMWDEHVSRWRFVNQFLYWHHSALAKRIFPQLSALMVWTVVAVWIVSTKTTPLSNIHLPMTSLSLISGFVASLLALRCNQGLERMLEGRQAFGKVVFYSRDLSSTIRHEVYPLAPQIALKLARHLAIFAWLLKQFLRGTKSNGTDEDLIRTMLPPADADFVLIQRKKPVAVTVKLRQAMHEICNTCNISTADELGIDTTIQKLDESIMLTERIVASPIPPLFTTHAGRLLCFYLFFLPLALAGSGSMTYVGTIVTVLAVGYAMLGLDEISHLMEQPFKLSPLYHLCKKTMRDVADHFCLEIPKLDDTQNTQYKPTKPPYWTDDTEQHDIFE